ncbi:hypothetical protein CCB80_04215 [Armatimonadetes bacterium Uphvl-Ar1]|nr:hypothetical protein CCB80_04215 [Armatimonadetes bacterium Uphvl-Ar1]
MRLPREEPAPGLNRGGDPDKPEQDSHYCNQMRQILPAMLVEGSRGVEWLASSPLKSKKPVLDLIEEGQG